MRSSLVSFAATFVAIFSVALAAEAAPAVSAAYVEGRLLAPCCYTQTLDVHESELATALRLEIGERVARGESGSAIEEDMVARYGARVRAVPVANDARGAGSIALALGAFAALALLAFAVARHVRRSNEDPAARPPPPSTDTGYDARVDAELAALDD